ncbi:hypothetical protein KA005_83035, partial [bacterium]|nr:hypothetical protein [bacterium]
MERVIQTSGVTTTCNLNIMTSQLLIAGASAQREKSLSGNRVNRKWTSGEQGAGREIKNQSVKCKNTNQKLNFRR